LDLRNSSGQEIRKRITGLWNSMQQIYENKELWDYFRKKKGFIEKKKS
jgi:hypothetical protein